MEPFQRGNPIKKIPVTIENPPQAILRGPASGQARSPEPSLFDYLGIIVRRKVPILLFVLAAVVAAYFFSRRLPTIYEASLIMDIDRQPQSSLMGMESNNGGAALDLDQVIATQIHLIQSDPVLRPVVEKYGLFAGDRRVQSLPPNERARFDASPITLKNLKVLRPPNTFLVQLSFRDGDPERAAEVANAIAASYTSHLDQIRRNSWNNLSSFTSGRLEELKAAMERSGKDLQQIERDLGMVDPEDKTNIVNARLQQLNVDYSHALADRANREAAYEAIRRGDPDAAQASPQAEALKKLAERQNEALQKFTDIKAVYGDSHPEYKRAAAQVREVEDELAAARRGVIQRVGAELREAQLREANIRKEYDLAKAQADRLMARSLPYRLLKQKADADLALYNEFVRKLGEADINTGVQKSGVRIAERARAPLRPVSPNVPLNCGIAMITASLLAMLAAVLIDSARDRIRKVEDVRAPAGIDVLGALPRVKSWQRHASLGSAKPTDAFVEAVRMLRSSMLACADRRGVRTLLVASPRPQEGRSTVAAHLALACADLGLKTVLIDGDLRKPSLHALCFLRGPLMGLANVLRGEIRWQSAVSRQRGRALLHVIPAGGTSPGGLEPIIPGLVRLLEEAGRQCDLVILDSPPLLECAQTIEMARVVDSVLLVVRANRSDSASLQAALTYLDRLEANVIGIVVNEL